ncbi:HVO_A0114 family putative DNA-binding protein [Haloarchaeobius sp. DT45]|uniref:HVO_A0114 family putative DNA-binding protein n=1 Tax=Haloarchaeobius sp. DT45 TaxID=3446116 RepID=UPI003F6C4BE2
MATRPEADAETDTLQVRLESAEEFYARLGGGDRDALSIRSEEELARLFAPSNLRLLRTLRDEHPTTVASLTAAVDHDLSEVETRLKALESFGLIDLVEHDKSVRPVPKFDEIAVTIPLS